MIVLTGATGFVGRQILRTLLQRGRKVRVLARDPARLSNATAEASLEIAQTDDLFKESSQRLEQLLAGAKTLIHAAWYAEPGKYLASPLNLDCLTGTLQLARAFAQVGGKRFIGVGTCFEYDLNRGLLTTSTPLAPNSLYASCKVAAYHVLEKFLPGAGVEFAWCRLFYLYGEGEDERRLVPIIRKHLEAGTEVPLTAGAQIRDYLDTRIAGVMIADVALGEASGAVNVCSGTPITVRELAERVADEYGRRDLLRFGAIPAREDDPPRVVGVK